MHEGIKNSEAYEGREAVVAGKVRAILETLVDEPLTLDEYDGTFEIDTDTFTFSFTIEDDLIEIRSIEARGEGGLGRAMIEAVQDVVREERYTLIASNVLDTAVGFWKKLGFVPSSTDGEYYWEVT